MKFVFHDFHCGFHNVVDIHQNHFRLLLPREFQQTLDDAFAPLGFFDDNIQTFFKLTPFLNFFAQVGAIQQNAGQRIVYLMGDTGGHSAQRRSFFHLGSQMIELGLLIFHQLYPFNYTGAMHGNGSDEIQFIF